MGDNNLLLWCDKYRINQLDKLSLHSKINQNLKKLARDTDNFPHLLFTGISGAGKKTRVAGILRELYGSNADKLKYSTRTIVHETSSGSKKNIEIASLSSTFHIEVNPSDVGHKDRIVVQELIKETARSVGMGGSEQKCQFKIVILNEADKLTKDAQHALRRTMEKYSGSCRMILICNSSCRLIDALRSRCLTIRIPGPSEEEIEEVLFEVAKKEGIQLPKPLAQKISAQAEGNLRRAILTLESCKVKCYPLKDNLIPELPDWQQYIIGMAKEISQEQSPQKLLVAREKLYELLTHCIPPELILKELVLQLLKLSDADLKIEILQWAAFYDHRLHLGSNPIFHLEAFVAKFMALYKRFFYENNK